MIRVKKQLGHFVLPELASVFCSSLNEVLFSLMEDFPLSLKNSRRMLVSLAV